jgi:glycosyltransferase involved in cell wall biosynthesis
MKILHVIASMDPKTGGTCQLIRNLAAWFDENGHVMEVVCLDAADSSFLSQDKFPIHALGQSRSQWSYHPALLSWLTENLPRFDAAILNGLWQYPGYALMKATRSPGMPPYFIFPHGMLDPWFQRNPERRVKAIRNWFYWKIIEERVVHAAEGLLFTSLEEMKLARETFTPYSPKCELNVGCGIPRPPEYDARMEAAFAEKCPAVKGKPYFLFLSRIHSKKGIDLLINAYSEFYRSQNAAAQSKIPKLVIAGPGLETPFGQDMQKLAAQICPPDSVSWPGMLTGDAKWGALYHCEAFVLPSHQENFGIAVVEALACGRPVLISDQVNIWREIFEDDAGLVASDKLEGARELLRRWESRSPTEKAVMTKAAKSSYENRFTVALTAQRLLAAVAGIQK